MRASPGDRSDADRLRDEMIEMAREFTEEVDTHDRERTALCAYRFAGRAEALLEWFDRAAATEGDS